MGVHCKDKSTGPPAHCAYMKLPAHGFCADVNANRRFGTPRPHYMICNATVTALRNVSTLQKQNLQLIVEYVGGKQFHKQTCCIGGILLHEVSDLFRMAHSFTNRQAAWLRASFYTPVGKALEVRLNLRGVAQYFGP